MNIASQDILFPQWRNGNEEVNYPFSDGATLVNENGQTINRHLFVDARLYPVGGLAGMYLSRVSVLESEVRFYVANPNGSEIAYGLLPYPGVPANGEIPVVDLHGRAAGVLVSTEQQLQEVPAAFSRGDTSFTAAQTEFAATAAIPIPDIGIRGFITDDGQVVFGDVYLVGDDGIVLSDDSSGEIRVDMIGDPYAKVKDCDTRDPLPAYCPLKTINGISPDENGDWKITIGGNSAIDNVFRVTQVAEGVFMLSAVGQIGGRG